MKDDWEKEYWAKRAQGQDLSKPSTMRSGPNFGMKPNGPLPRNGQERLHNDFDTARAFNEHVLPRIRPNPLVGVVLQAVAHRLGSCFCALRLFRRARLGFRSRPVRPLHAHQRVHLRFHAVDDRRGLLLLLKLGALLRRPLI